MIVVARKDGLSEDYRIRIAHWWPGRRCRLPAVPLAAFRSAVRDQSRYLTIASVDLGGVEVSAYARCCRKDNPTRQAGRFIALLRLARILKSLGYRIEKTL